MISDGARNLVRVGVLALLWGSTFLWISVALDGFSPAQVTFARCVLGAAALLLVCRLGGHRLPTDRSTWRHLSVAALLCNALPFALFSIGQRTVESGTAGVLNATTPLWALLLGLASGAERDLRPIRLGGLLLGFAGVVTIFAPWRHGGLVSWNALAILGAAASYAAAFAYMGRTLVGRGVPTIVLSSAQLLAAAGWSALFLPVGGLDAPQVTVTSVGALVVLALGCTALTFHLTYKIITHEGATNAASVGYLLPVVSVALGALLLDEPVTLRMTAGMIVVLLGVGMTRWRPRRQVAAPGRTGDRLPEPAGAPERS
ncbi:DMT family transporter [Micromonospora sp. DR5-3]|uniref:DMT family transporter n=1 Tax=unclassified Micromonospora TaxID=2617518 RepID=UPI0011D7843A|nr:MULTISPECIES: DMT family transporter [unclassified Micromonospora]MCW3818568.1 DMT family transporter [Micromonospora sp. DR5-3]TYC20149.1 DMT family transporter [Micromonospora sp. MP36]